MPENRLSPHTMPETMLHNNDLPREVTDVAYAIFDGTDAKCFGETAYRPLSIDAVSIGQK